MIYTFFILKNKVSIVINDFGDAWGWCSYFIGVDSEHDVKRFDCIEGKEKILVYAESDDVYTVLLKSYYDAANVCEKLSDERRKKYNQCAEFHEYGNIITIFLDRAEDETLPEDLRIIEVHSVDFGYDKSSLFGALAECFYKMLNIIIYQEKYFKLVKSEIIPYKKINDNGILEWKLDSDL